MRPNRKFSFNTSLFHSGCRFIFISVIILISFPNSLLGQLTTNSAVTPADLVNNIVGPGITVSNIKYTGAGTARGLFYKDNSNIGLDNGIILSTGRISNATGPNNDPRFGYCNRRYVTQNISGSPGDLDLDLIENCTQCTYDAAVLEFDFIPQSSPLTFKYVFASEEYPCYVCSPFNDVFAFLVTSLENDGLNYNNENIALIPNTTIPVCINSINSGTAGYDSIGQRYFSDCISLNYNTYFVNNGDGSTPALNPTVQFNGFTVPLAASIKVTPCKKYHIKLAVANVADDFFDSAVLLQANSFASPSATGTITYSYDNNAIEGCSNASICYNLPEPLATDYNIPLQFSGTANIGTDYIVTGINYVSLPPGVTIPAGQTTSCITISPPILPGNTTKQVIVTANTSVCTPEVDIISILPNTVLSASFNPSAISVCRGASATLSVIASGGITSKPYQYAWSNGAGNFSEIIVSTTITNTYTVSVTDDCGAAASASIEVKVLPPPDITIDDATICSGTSATLTVKGVGQGSSYLWNTGETTSSITVNPSVLTQYFVTVEYNIGCFAEGSATVSVTPPPLADFTADVDSGCQPLTVRFTDNSQFTNPASAFLWNFGDGQTSTDENPVHIYNNPGIYTVSLRVSNATILCSDTKVSTDMINVFSKPVAKFYVQPGSTVSELDPTVLVFSNSVGDIASYEWKLSDTNTVYTDPSFSHTFKAAGTYKIKLYIVNDKGCTDTTSGMIFVKPECTLYVPNAFKPSRCNEPEDCLFKVKSTKVLEFQIWIYDRWGGLAYNSKEIKDGWDGKISGTLATEGVYIYRIDYRDVFNRPHTIWGHLTLLR
jgi:gliding motility-associated-like protein